MNPRNYQRELDSLLKKQSGKKTLLLHCCCAPCSSYVLEYLHEYFDITVLFYNPNISEQAEYDKRKQELIRYIHTVSYGNTVQWIDCDHEPEKFEAVATGYEKEPERGKRCYRCYHLRLSYTAAVAEKGNPFYNLPASDETLENFKEHQALLGAYAKLQKAKRENWK